MTQDTALSILKTGENVFLTGAAGAGKTYVLNQYIQYLKDKKIPVAITASTGIAATHINGQTIHSWAGMGINKSLSARQIEKLSAKKYLKKNIEHAAVLIIDEISMLHKDQLEMLDQILQHFKASSMPYGGMQLVVSGDFLQLPPISQTGESAKERFSFMAPSWVKADFKICYLTLQYRSTDKLNELLNEMRKGSVSDKSIKLIQDKIAQSSKVKKDCFPQLHTHNIDIDYINQTYLSNLKGEEATFTVVKKGNPKLVENLLQSVLSPEKLYLKVGAKVIFVRNNLEAAYINGTLGEVVDFSSDGWPYVVKKDKSTIEVKPEKWHIADENGRELASIKQVPLRLAWAITVHKSQGMTLEEAIMDLSKTFEKGQGFVALSRLKTWEKLNLLGCNNYALQLDPLALRADKRFLELSNELETRIDKTDLEKKHSLFIEKYSKPTYEKDKKKPTTETTYELLLGGQTVEQIASERGLTLTTILTHVEKLIKEGKKIDSSLLSPGEKILNDFWLAFQNISIDNGLSLKSIYDYHKGKISYNELQKAHLYFMMNQKITINH